MEQPEQTVDIFHNPFLNISEDTGKKIIEYLQSESSESYLEIIPSYEFGIISSGRNSSRTIIWSSSEGVYYHDSLVALSQHDPAWKKISIWDSGSIELKCEYGEIILAIGYDGGCSATNLRISLPFIQKIVEHVKDFLERLNIETPLLTVEYENLDSTSFEERTEPMSEIC